MSAKALLEQLNSTYLKLHKKYEDLFWISYMGDHSVNKQKDQAQVELNKFRANSQLLKKVEKALESADKSDKEKLAQWQKFFHCYQLPPTALKVREKIMKLESAAQKKRSSRKEGYIDPNTKKFVPASSGRMSSIMSTHPDEGVRRACFDAKEKFGLSQVGDYLKLVNLRNQFARLLGYKDFYDFKVQTDDGMTKKELFDTLGQVYKKTKYALADIRKLENKMPGLRKPWNFGYMMSGDFIKEEDPYFQFDEALERWGRSFAALGVDFKGATLQLDLADRKGKYNNGFCHWPDPVYFKNGRRVPGSSNFTCNVVPGQVGSGVQGYDTLFHEGGHAAHILNSEQTEACINTEYEPMPTPWAETQSMFMDTMFSSIEWRTRYAKNNAGQAYPFDLYERRVKKLFPNRPLGLNGIIAIAEFEKIIYETKNPQIEFAKETAVKIWKKYFDYSVDSYRILDVPHLYSFENSASYHGYGLAMLSYSQWREYFYDKYGHIVDNPKVGAEMKKVWELAASKNFKEFVILATGKKLSADPFLKNATLPLSQVLKQAKDRISVLKKVKEFKGPVKFNALIRMVDGKKLIADNSKSFEDMAAKYKKWLRSKAEK